MRKIKLLVCFKVVRDLDTVIEQDWLNAKDISFDIDYTKRIINCFDESALETALYLADTAKKTNTACIETVALTISNDNIADILKNLCAIKYSRVVNIQCDADLRFNPRAVAHIISRFVKAEAGFDAVLMGYQANAGNNSQTAFLVAELLNLPCVNMVYDIALINDGFRVVHQTSNGMRHVCVTSPAVFAFGNAKHTYLRTATLREKLAASNNNPIVRSIEEFGLEPSMLAEYADKTVLSIYCEKKKRECYFINAETAEEKAGLLVEKYIRKVVDVL